MKDLNVNQKTVFITGGAGFIGFHLSRQLLRQGVTVVAVDNLNNYYDVRLKKTRLDILKEYNHFTFIEGDLSDKELVADIFGTNRHDVVVHLAAQAGVRYSIENPDAYIQSNIVGFHNILEACRNYGTDHLVFASSSSVYGANKKVPFSVEDKADQPVSLYAATKKSNEAMAYSYSYLYGVPMTGLRFFTVYGPYGRPDMAYFLFAEKITAGEPIKIFNNGDMYRDFTYIDDVTETIGRLMSHPPLPDENGTKYKLYNIGNSHPERLSDFIAEIERCLGKTAIKEYYPMQDGDVYQTYADVSGIMEDFAYSPRTTIQDGISKFVDWYRAYYK